MRPVLIAAVCSVGIIAAISYFTYSGYKTKSNQQQKTVTRPIAPIVEKAAGSPPAIVVTLPTIDSSKPAKQTIEKDVVKPKPSPKEQPERNEFVYMPADSKTIKGTQGTTIWIPDHAFVDEFSGEPITIPVNVKLNEYYKMDDIVFNDLHTMSNQGLLETNGMINVSVTADGKACKFADNKFMRVDFPMVNNKPDMQLFWKDQNDLEAVWQSIDYAPYGDLMNRNQPSEIVKGDRMPTLPNGLPALKTYLDNSIIASYQNWSGNMKLEVVVSAWGTTEHVSVLKEFDAYASSQVAIALHKLTWKRGYINGQPSRFKAIIDIEYRKYQGISKLDFSKQFEHAPYNEIKLPGLPTRSFKVSRLGWINCDRFYMYAKRTEFKVKMQDSAVVNVKMIFDKLKAIIPANGGPLTYSFKNIPVNEPVTIIAFKKDGDCFLVATESTNTSAKQITELNYKSVTKEELQDIILSLDKISTPNPVNSTAMR